MKRFTITDILDKNHKIKELGAESKVMIKKQKKEDIGPDYKKFFFDCDHLGIPRPVLEYRFHKIRKWRVDLAWPEQKLAVEIEGGAFTGGRHTNSINGFLGDIEKYNALAFEHWFLLRTIPEDIKTGDAAVMVYEYFKKKFPGELQ